MRTFIVSSLLAAAACGFAACSGGGSSSAPYAVPTAPPTAAATTAPTTGPSTAPTAAPSSAATTTLATATLLGSSGFVAPSGLTAYILSDDTTTSLACTVANGCTGVWFPIAPPSGAALSTGFASFTRPDTKAAQLAYNGHPLYTFAGDTAAGQTNGNGLVSFGGTWTVARP